MDVNILNHLLDNRIIDELKYSEEVDSTNMVAKNLARDGHAGTALCISEIQTAGRGRSGHSWSSPPGTGIWMSLLVKPEIPAASFPKITILAAIAIARAIAENTDCNVKIKWPNDVIIGNKKVCGILTEMLCLGNDNYAICGIGINVNTTEFPEELSDKATSILLSSGKITNRETLAVSVITHLTQCINEFEKCNNLSFILDEYNSLLISRNREVILTSANCDYPNNPYTALAIDEDGALIVKDCMGNVEKISTGEVSVRGLLGYVD